MNNAEDLQNLLKKEYLKGPEFKMDNKVGINYYSGDSESVFYELWGKEEIFQIIILKPSVNLYTTKFVGKNHLLILLVVENDQTIGGFISLKDEVKNQFVDIFPNLDENNVFQLSELWNNFVIDHYNDLLQK
ncbi:hypothetical protein [Paenibacillus kandeliae]|uniref:hypothetical protein n=1 Tax=Paenibacillus kandeliae TaxID=3231269 RepID=UPI00345AD1B2